MGRHRTPSSLKKLRGTDQPSRMTNEPQYQLLTKVSTPSVLKTNRARRMFREKSAMLIAQKVLQAPDIDLLTAYCNTCDLYLQAIEMQATENELIQSPYIKLQRELLPLINTMGALFGFSPISRGKISQPPYQESENNDFS